MLNEYVILIYCFNVINDRNISINDKKKEPRSEMFQMKKCKKVKLGKNIRGKMEKCKN